MSVVIVNFNGGQRLRRCVQSVLKSNLRNIEVIVVDNGSTDASIASVSDLSSVGIALRVIKNRKNLGPAAARNVGIVACTGKYVSFLDNDTEVDSEWLVEPVSIMEADPTVGACQSKLLLMSKPRSLDYVGDYLGPYGFLIQRARHGETDNGQFDAIEEIFTAKSAAMIVRRSVLEQVGVFDHEYFMYMEETDLCWRIWLRGFRVLLSPKSVVYHAFGTTRQILPHESERLIMYGGCKNYIRTLIKNLELAGLVRVLPIHMILWVGIAIWMVMHNRTRSASFVAAGLFWNIRHFRSSLLARRQVQHYVRRVPDALLSRSICRSSNIIQHFYKLARAPPESSYHT